MWKASGAIRSRACVAKNSTRPTGFSGVAVDVETPSGNIVRAVYGLPATFDGPNMSASYRAKAARLPLSNFYWNELARGALPEKGSPLRARLRDNLRTRRAKPYTWTLRTNGGHWLGKRKCLNASRTKNDIFKSTAACTKASGLSQCRLAASRRPGPSKRRTPASSSATPTGRRWPTSISRGNPAGRAAAKFLTRTWH
jgi:hypothetical protein